MNAYFDMEEKLNLLRDMQNFAHSPDSLDDILGGELDLMELDMVAAAAASPAISFEQFREMVQQRQKKSAVIPD